MPFLIFLLLTAPTTVLSAQAVVTIDYVKAEPGQLSRLIRYFQLNWAVARDTAIAQRTGVIGYRMVTRADTVSDWDVILETTYRDSATFERREEIFAPILKAKGRILVDGKGRAAYGQLLGSRVTTVTALSGLPTGGRTPVIERPARPEDVATIDAIIAAVYQVPSGAAGEARDWGRERSLYMPGAHFVELSHDSTGAHTRVLDHQAYVDLVNPAFLKYGFYEREIGRRTERFGNVVHVWSSYEWRNRPDGPVMGRGVNSMQLYWDGTRWFVTGIVWDAERKDLAIPANLLPSP